MQEESVKSHPQEEEEEEEDEHICTICRCSTEDVRQFGCGCKGGNGFYHQTCLKEAIQHMEKRGDCYKCVCKAHFLIGTKEKETRQQFENFYMRWFLFNGFTSFVMCYIGLFHKFEGDISIKALETWKFLLMCAFELVIFPMMLPEFGKYVFRIVLNRDRIQGKYDYCVTSLSIVCNLIILYCVPKFVWMKYTFLGVQVLFAFITLSNHFYPQNSTNGGEKYIYVDI